MLSISAVMKIENRIETRRTKGHIKVSHCNNVLKTVLTMKKQAFFHSSGPSNDGHLSVWILIWRFPEDVGQRTKELRLGNVLVKDFISKKVQLHEK